MVVKVRKVGVTLSITLPAKFSQIRHVDEGSEAIIIEQAHGVVITVYDAAFEKKLNAMKSVANRYVIC